MKIITKVLTVLMLFFINGFSSLFSFDVYNDPGITTPYQGEDFGLEEGVERAGTGIRDVINDDRSFSQVIQDVVIYFLGFITLIAVIYIIYAGFRILTSSGDEEIIKKSKNTIIYVVIGILVVWFAWTIANFAIGIGTGGN